MTDLAAADQRHFMHVVLAVERALRLALNPDKVNLASLGNMTPHLHWHVIPRFRDDRHFPNPVWGQVAARAHRAVQITATEISRSLQQALCEAAQQPEGSGIV
jgi:diadenosine tetraphosphate (Ap4A) HIT family hydrolase